MRAAGWIVALATAMTACTLRADLLYWMIDGEASKSFSDAYLQTLESAGGNAGNVGALLYSLDTSSGTRRPISRRRRIIILATLSQLQTSAVGIGSGSGVATGSP